MAPVITTRPPLRRAAAAALGGLLVAASAPAAYGQPRDPAAADAIFKEAQRLHAAGDDKAACPKYAESKRLDPGVGVTLHLADCYVKTGRTASAWKEFREAEKMARDKGDKRADLAAERAAALAPNLSRLTIEAPADAAQAGEQLQLDGAPLAADAWNVAFPVDPGDHVIVVTAPGQPSRTLQVHVEAGGASVTLPTGLSGATTPAFVLAPAGAAEAAAASPAPAAQPAVSAPAAAVSPSPEPVHPSSRGAAGRWVGAGLMLAGAAGIGLGTWLATYKTQDMADGVTCEPHLQAHAIPEAVVAFAAGGVALASGAVLFYMNWPGRMEMSLGPTAVPGGGGSVLRGRF